MTNTRPGPSSSACSLLTSDGAAVLSLFVDVLVAVVVVAVAIGAGLRTAVDLMGSLMGAVLDGMAMFVSRNR